jgi:flagellar protein FlgJ
VIGRVGAAPPAPGAGPAAEVRLREAAAEFEAIFVARLLEAMRGSLAGGGILPSGAGHAIYQSLLDSELARTVSRGRGLGLADMLVRELGRLDGAARKPSSPGPSRPISTNRTAHEPQGGVS